jgi:branched-chain amino acid transport system substrate-binding protein
MKKPLMATLGLLLAALAPAAAQTPAAPDFIKIGALYASSGPYASISFTCHKALDLWAEIKNAEGGVFVKAFGKKIPIKLIEYDDQSSTATAATLYNQLITQDKVDILLADSGSVLCLSRASTSSCWSTRPARRRSSSPPTTSTSC